MDKVFLVCNTQTEKHLVVEKLCAAGIMGCDEKHGLLWVCDNDVWTSRDVGYDNPAWKNRDKYTEITLQQFLDYIDRVGEHSPCPFCGSVDIKPDFLSSYMGPVFEVCSACKTCGAQGPIVKSEYATSEEAKKKATRLWNTGRK